MHAGTYICMAGDWLCQGVQALLCAAHPPEHRLDQVIGRPCCTLPLTSAWQASDKTKWVAV